MDGSLTSSCASVLKLVDGRNYWLHHCCDPRGTRCARFSPSLCPPLFLLSPTGSHESRHNNGPEPPIYLSLKILPIIGKSPQHAQTNGRDCHPLLVYDRKVEPVRPDEHVCMPVYLCSNRQGASPTDPPGNLFYEAAVRECFTSP